MTFEESDPLAGHSLQFAKAVREFCKHLPRTVSNVEDVKSLIQSSGEIGAKYLHSKGAVNRESFVGHMRASQAEAITTKYWLNIVDTQGMGELEKHRTHLLRAADELIAILQSLIDNMLNS